MAKARGEGLAKKRVYRLCRVSAATGTLSISSTWAKPLGVGTGGKAAWVYPAFAVRTLRSSTPRSPTLPLKPRSQTFRVLGRMMLEAAVTLWDLGYERVRCLAGGIDRRRQEEARCPTSRRK